MGVRFYREKAGLDDFASCPNLGSLCDKKDVMQS